MHLPRRVALALALLSLGLVACKQDVGQRCEQGSDCATGYCGESVGGMVSAMGKTCTEPPTAAQPVDAATNDAATNDAATNDAGTNDDASDASDAARDVRDAASPDGSGEASSPDGAEGGAGEAGAETSGADGATDLPESDAGG
jgi:hypothetical protein